MSRKSKEIMGVVMIMIVVVSAMKTCCLCFSSVMLGFGRFGRVLSND